MQELIKTDIRTHREHHEYHPSPQNHPKIYKTNFRGSSPNPASEAAPIAEIMLKVAENHQERLFLRPGDNLDAVVDEFSMKFDLNIQINKLIKTELIRQLQQNRASIEVDDTRLNKLDKTAKIQKFEIEELDPKDTLHRENQQHRAPRQVNSTHYQPTRIIFNPKNHPESTEAQIWKKPKNSRQRGSKALTDSTSYSNLSSYAAINERRKKSFSKKFSKKRQKSRKFNAWQRRRQRSQAVESPLGSPNQPEIDMYSTEACYAKLLSQEASYRFRAKQAKKRSIDRSGEVFEGYSGQRSGYGTPEEAVFKENLRPVLKAKNNPFAMLLSKVTVESSSVKSPERQNAKNQLKNPKIVKMAGSPIPPKSSKNGAVGVRIDSNGSVLVPRTPLDDSNAQNLSPYEKLLMKLGGVSDTKSHLNSTTRHPKAHQRSPENPSTKQKPSKTSKNSKKHKKRKIQKNQQIMNSTLERELVEVSAISGDCVGQDNSDLDAFRRLLNENASVLEKASHDLINVKTSLSGAERKVEDSLADIYECFQIQYNRLKDQNQDFGKRQKTQKNESKEAIEVIDDSQEVRGGSKMTRNRSYEHIKPRVYQSRDLKKIQEKVKIKHGLKDREVREDGRGYNSQYLRGIGPGVGGNGPDNSGLRRSQNCEFLGKKRNNRSSATNLRRSREVLDASRPQKITQSPQRSKKFENNRKFEKSPKIQKLLPNPKKRSVNQLTRSYTHVVNRLLGFAEARDLKITKKREIQKTQKEQKIKESLQNKPKLSKRTQALSSKLKPQSYSDVYHKLFYQGLEKMKKQEERNQLEFAKQHPFTPNLGVPDTPSGAQRHPKDAKKPKKDEKSRNLTKSDIFHPGDPKAGQRLYRRLMQAHHLKEGRLEVIRHIQTKFDPKNGQRLFKPKISEKSRSLSARRLQTTPMRCKGAQQPSIKSKEFFMKDCEAFLRKCRCIFEFLDEEAEGVIYAQKIDIRVLHSKTVALLTPILLQLIGLEHREGLEGSGVDFPLFYRLVREGGLEEYVERVFDVIESQPGVREKRRPPFRV